MSCPMLQKAQALATVAGWRTWLSGAKGGKNGVQRVLGDGSRLQLPVTSSRVRRLMWMVEGEMDTGAGQGFMSS